MAGRPTQKSLELLREMGAEAQVVEKRLPKCMILKDLFGCIDILAMTTNNLLLAVQTTDRTNHSKRLVKSMEEPLLLKWLTIPSNRFEIHSWKKQGERGKAKHWMCNIQSVERLGGMLVACPVMTTSTAEIRAGKRYLLDFAEVFEPLALPQIDDAPL